MDRTTKIFIAVVTLVASIMLAVNHVIDQAPIADWWLAALLLIISGVFWVWLWQEERAESTALTTRDDTRPVMQEWIISKEATDAVNKTEGRMKDAVAKVMAEAAGEPVQRAVPPPAVTPEPEVAPEPPVVVAAEPEPEQETVVEPITELDPAADANAVIPANLPPEIAAEGDLVPEPEIQPESPPPTVTISAEDADEPDDLERVEGIGPRYREALYAAGITEFEQLANMTLAEIEDIIQKAGMRRSASMPTWAEQAKLAAAGDWDALNALQSTLTAGRRG